MHAPSPLIALILLAATVVPGAALAEPGDPFGTSGMAPAQAAQSSPQASALPCGESPPPTAALGLRDVIDLALCRNPRTRETWSAARVAAAQTGAARAPYLPGATISAQAQTFDQRNTPTAGQRQQGSGTLGFNYLLFDFGGRSATLEQARQTLSAANWTHDATLQQVMLDAAQAYHQLYASEEAVVAARTAETSALTSLEAARARQRAGTATRADVLQSQTAWSQALLSRTQSEGDAAVARGVLANRIGLPASRDLRIAAPPDAAPQAAGEEAVERLIDAATERRPDLRAALARVRAAEANVTVQESAGLPTVSLFGNAARTETLPGLDTRTAAVGVSVNFPLFTGFRDTYTIRAAREQIALQQAGADRLRNDISLEVWQAYQDVRTQAQSIKAASDLTASAQESYDVALGRYRAGVGTVTDLMTAQSLLANATLQRIQARFRWHVAKLSLARAVGRLDRDLFADAPAPPRQ